IIDVQRYVQHITVSVYYTDGVVGINRRRPVLGSSIITERTAIRFDAVHGAGGKRPAVIYMIVQQDAGVYANTPVLQGRRYIKNRAQHQPYAKSFPGRRKVFLALLL